MLILIAWSFCNIVWLYNQDDRPNGDRTYLWNVGQLQRGYTALYTRTVSSK
jgi:hypothetical protein